jgi:hypothetical protein
MPSWKDKIWRSSIGHYGGMHVSVPAEHAKEFIAVFPKRELPKEIRKVDVTQTLTGYGSQRFVTKFPKSGHTYYEMYFSDRSKGMKRFEDLFPRESCVIE